MSEADLVAKRCKCCHQPIYYNAIRLADEVERLRKFGEKVNIIRNSIVGLQTINWSEHIYPLVAVLNEAGFDGEGYPEAKANLGTLLERNERLWADNERLCAAPYI